MFNCFKFMNKCCYTINKNNSDEKIIMVCWCGMKKKKMRNYFLYKEKKKIRR